MDAKIIIIFKSKKEMNNYLPKSHAMKIAVKIKSS